MYDLVRLGAKAGLVPRVLVVGDHLVHLFEKFTIVGGVSYLRYHRVQSLLLGVMSSKSALNLMTKILRMK